MTLSNIFRRIGSKLIGLKFVGSSISPELFIGIIIECFRGLGNTFIDVLIINVIYRIVTIRLSLICWRLIWSCPVDLVFLSSDIANITSTTCTGWGLYKEDFLVIRRCVLSCLYPAHQVNSSDSSVSRRCAFSPLLLQKNYWRCLHSCWGSGNCICFASIFQELIALVGARCFYDLF